MRVVARGEKVSLREAARLASTARPSAPPIMKAVLTTPGGKAGFLRLDVAHRCEQQRVESHARAEAEQDHAREHVDDEVCRRPAPARKQQSPSRASASPVASGARRPIADDEHGREADRERCP